MFCSPRCFAARPWPKCPPKKFIEILPHLQPLIFSHLIFIPNDNQCAFVSARWERCPCKPTVPEIDVRVLQPGGVSCCRLVSNEIRHSHHLEGGGAGASLFQNICVLMCLAG